MKHHFFSPANERFRAEVRDLVERKLRPHATEWEKAQRFPREVIEACGRRGYLALDPWRYAVLAEELPRCESLGGALSVFLPSNLIAPALAQFDQNTWLKSLRRGELVGAMAVSEPTAGSDFASLKTMASGRS